VRAALALAVAVSASRPDGLEATQAEALLARLDGPPLVRARVAAARAALAIGRDGAAALDEATSEAGLRLALALARRVDDPRPTSAALSANVAAALEAALAKRDSAPLRAARACAALDAWSSQAARADLERALRLDPAQPLALELSHQLAALAEPDEAPRDTPSLARLRSLDPAAADDAAARAAAARRFRVVALPASDGAARVVCVAREPDPLGVTLDEPAMHAALTVHAAWARLGERGLEGRTVTRVLTRFGLSSVRAVAMEGRQGPGAAAGLAVALHSGRVEGRTFGAGGGGPAVATLDGQPILNQRLIAPAPVDGMRVAISRGAFTVLSLSRDGERPRETRVLRGDLQPRDAAGGSDVMLHWGWHGTYTLERLVLVGRLDLQGLPPLRPQRRLVPADGGLAPYWDESWVPQAATPATLDDLRRDGARLALPAGRHPWVGPEWGAPMLVVPGLRGDMVVRARVTQRASRPDHQLGIALRRGVDVHSERVLVVLSHLQERDRTPWDGAPFSITLASQRIIGWEGPLGGVPWREPTAVLSLERRGDWVIARAGADADRLERVCEPIYFPLGEPLVACFFARAYVETEPHGAVFDQVEVLLQDDR
jgi:hypothetical protein